MLIGPFLVRVPGFPTGICRSANRILNLGLYHGNCGDRKREEGKREEGTLVLTESVKIAAP